MSAATPVGGGAAALAAARPPAPAGPAPIAPRRGRWRPRGEELAGWAFVTPISALLALFVLVPLVGSVVLSVQRTDGFGSGEWVGLANYARLVQDPLFWRSALNTVVFTVLVTPASMALGLAAAVLMNSVLPARGVFRSVLILPMAVSGVATALMGVLVFDENNGILDGLLRAAGLPAVPWQSGGVAAFASLVLVTLWWRVGFNMLVYLAGLQAVDPALREAALLDGAGTWQRFRHVTVPMVRPSTSFLLILNVIYSFQVFDLVFVLTGGGPRNATSVLVTYAYDTGFVTRDQGYATAIGVVLLGIMLVFTVVQRRVSRSRELDS